MCFFFFFFCNEHFFVWNRWLFFFFCLKLDAALSQEQLVEKVQQAVKCREAAEAEMARVRMIMGIKSPTLTKLEEGANSIWAMPIS